MGKFDSLKWVPILIKAYNEARQLKESASAPIKSPTELLVQPKNLATPTIKIPSKKKPSQVKPAQDSTLPLPDFAQKPQEKSLNKTYPYQSLLRELRVTKRKLHRLETTHKQLTTMQIQLQGDLKKLTEQLEKPTYEANEASQKTID